jgi:predicted nuclease of predicted toxin-antitoxin system
MAYRLILDENIEHEVLYRLEDDGHDVEHVEFVSKLGKGTSGYPIARYSLSTDRVIVTYDDDFVLEVEVDESEYRAVIYIKDTMLLANQVAQIIHTMSQHYPQDQINSVEHVGQEWLQDTHHDTRSGMFSRRLCHAGAFRSTSFNRLPFVLRS